MLIFGILLLLIYEIDTNIKIAKQENNLKFSGLPIWHGNICRAPLETKKGALRAPLLYFFIMR